MALVLEKISELTKVGWVKGDDGLLILDKNNNNQVDNVLELFGKQNKTGTEELREYDLNLDNKIDSKDAVFSKLKIWQDLNSDAVSQANELKSLTDLNIKEINLNNLTTLNQISEGNVIISTGTFTKSTSSTSEDGSITQTESTGTYANLDLAVNQSNSTSYIYTDASGNVIGDYNLNLEALSLPMIRGYGNVKALPIAASQSEELLQALKGMKSLGVGDYKNIDSKIEEIIFLWAGVKDVSGMRGVFDGRKLAAMEKIRGEGYRNSRGSNFKNFY